MITFKIPIFINIKKLFIEGGKVIVKYDERDNIPIFQCQTVYMLQ